MYTVLFVLFSTLFMLYKLFIHPHSYKFLPKQFLQILLVVKLMSRHPQLTGKHKTVTDLQSLKQNCGLETCILVLMENLIWAIIAKVMFEIGKTSVIF